MSIRPGITQYQAERFLNSVLEYVKPEYKLGFEAGFKERFSHDGINPYEVRQHLKGECLDMMSALPDGTAFRGYSKQYLTLGEVIEATFRLFTEQPPQMVHIPDVSSERVQIIANGNAKETAKLLIGKGPIYSDAETYQDDTDGKMPDRVILFSASGGKGIDDAARFYNGKCAVVLITATNGSPAARALDDIARNTVIVTPKTAEMYTHNVSTYIGMALAMLGRDIRSVIEYIKANVDPALAPHLKGSCREQKLTFTDAFGFYFWVPDGFEPIVRMYDKKVTELFGLALPTKVQVVNEGWHGEHAVRVADALHVHIGAGNQGLHDLKNTLLVPLPDDASLIERVAIGYYVIGKMLDSRLPWFEFIMPYRCMEIAQKKGWDIAPVVKP